MRVSVLVLLAGGLAGCSDFPAELTQGQFLDVVAQLDVSFDHGADGSADGGDGQVLPDVDEPDEGPLDSDVVDAGPDGEDVPDTTDVPDAETVDDVPDVDEDTLDAEDTQDTDDAEEVDAGPGCFVDASVCDDGDPCTTDACDPVAGCQNVAVVGCVPPLVGWNGVVRLDVFEPVRGADDAPSTLLEPESQQLHSSFPRVEEPVEVPLRAVDPGTVTLWYPFDGNLQSTGTATATVTNDGSSFVPGVSGQALQPNPRIHIAAPPPDGKPVTLMFWASPPGPTTEVGSVVGFFPPPGTPPFQLGLSQGNWVLRLGKETTIPLAAANEGWQHVAVTWDPTRALGQLYLDGRLAATYDEPLELTNAFLLVGEPGAKGSGGTGAPVAAVDELVYLQRVLDPLEIGAVARLGKTVDVHLVPGVEAQADWDDVRVTRGAPGAEEPVPFEVIGRRPHSDSSPAAAKVGAYFRMDGTLEATLGGAQAVGGTLDPEPGAFGDVGGALRFADTTTRLWTNRTIPLTAPFAIETWVRLEGATADCNSGSDGTFLLQNAAAGPGPEQGWVLRICDGLPRFEARGGGLTGALEAVSSIEDGGWHHVLVDVAADRWTLYVDGVPDASLDVVGGAVLDGLHALTVGYGFSGSGQKTPATPVVLDDLVVHRAVRGAGYAWQRVHPVVPTVRFLASTEPGAPHAMPTYAVHLGNPDATFQPPGDGCESLLAGCRGYLGWWRMDAPPGTPAGFVPDVSGAGRHALAAGPLTYDVGADGLAVRVDASTGLAADVGALPVSWTVEAVARPDALGGTQTVLHLVGLGGASMFLRVVGSAIEHGFEGLVASLSSPPVPTTLWARFTGVLDRDAPPETLSVLGGDQMTKVNVGEAAPPETDGPLFFGTDGASGVFGGRLDDVRWLERPAAAPELLKVPRLSWLPQ